MARGFARVLRLARMDRAAARLLLESQHSFPSDQRFHVIVRSAEGTADAVSAAIAAHCGLAVLGAREERVTSRAGNYTSLRLSLPCADADAVLDLYALFGGIPGIIRYF